MVTCISATVSPIGVKFCVKVLYVPDVSSPFLGRYPKGIPKSKILAGLLKSEYVENSKSQRYMLIISSARRQIFKNAQHLTVAPRGVPIKKMCICARDRHPALFGMKICTMVHIGPGQIFSLFGGGTPRDPKILTF